MAIVGVNALQQTVILYLKSNATGCLSPNSLLTQLLGVQVVTEWQCNALYSRRLRRADVVHYVDAVGTNAARYLLYLYVSGLYVPEDASLST